MPRVTDPEVIEQKVKDPEISESSKEVFGERMRRVFKPTDTVQIINLCSESIEWIYMDPDSETYTIEDDSNIKIVSREKPDLWKLDTGEIDVLDGGCAYRALEVMFKQKCVEGKGTNPNPLDERDIIIYEWDDPEAQERFFKKAYLGKITPQMMKEAALREIAKNEQVPKRSSDKSSDRSERVSKTSKTEREPATSTK
jgi:hypothetical protein